MSLSTSQKLYLEKYEQDAAKGLEELAKSNFGVRLWEKDATAWKSEEVHQKSIKNRLGWLRVVSLMKEKLPEIQNLAEDVKNAGFTHALLLGMGGSSLCPDVFKRTFGVKSGYLDLSVLDSTDPASILSHEKSVNLEKTLFFVSTKSGTTAETLSFYHYFYEKLLPIKGDKTGENFVAITDPGTPLIAEGEERGFRKLFLNPSDIGGRYSALSYFGLVPGAVLGIDISEMLNRATEMAEACGSDVAADKNPGLILGNALGRLALAGRAKLTFLISEPIESFGDWVEQLIAESTGKEGKGILPVVSEPLGNMEAYGDDRVFVYLRLDTADNSSLDAKAEAIQKAGHPVITIQLRDLLDLGHEFYRWEVATATMGVVLKENPFDEPNVKESKDNTNALLAVYKEKGKLPEEKAVLSENGISLFCDEETKKLLSTNAKSQTLAGYLAAHLNTIQSGDYVALMAFLPMDSAATTEFQSVRTALREHYKIPSTLGYGPRFLHSTGQLHKGGPNKGVFIQITREAEEKISIPGQPHDFATLERAQAMGDFGALRGKNRRAIRFHITGDVLEGVKKICNLVKAAL